MNNLFLGYSSRYVGAFDLLDTFKYPKMCAQESVNMTKGVQYYRGQKDTPYSLNYSNGASDAVMNMDQG